MASTLPHGSQVVELAMAGPAALKVPDKSSCPLTSAIVLPPEALFTPVICPAGSRE